MQQVKYIVVVVRSCSQISLGWLQDTLLLVVLYVTYIFSLYRRRKSPQHIHSAGNEQYNRALPRSSPVNGDETGETDEL